MTDEPSKHKRRVRYKGKNPRRFQDRYKELDPSKYKSDVEHIMAKGQTPAGSHRPICVEEILSVLAPKPGETCLDATLGYGGHSRKLIEHILPNGRLFAVDVDSVELPKTEERLRALGYEEDTFIVRKMNFTGIRSLLFEADGGFDCILADLGVSSMQLDNPARGFTYKVDGPLDLRLDPHRGRSASELLQGLSCEQLQSILTEHADEPYAKEISQAIVKTAGPIERTGLLVEIVQNALAKIRPRVEEKMVKKSVQRTFMALRIELNQELSGLDHFLRLLPDCLKPGGRVAILTFHSGEDRRVKKAFSHCLKAGIYSSISPAPIRPSAEECRSNPRASCAKLRWAILAE